MNFPKTLNIEIERKVNALLHRYSVELGITIEAPIDVDVIAEIILGYAISHGSFENPEILGGLYVKDKEIKINQAITPDIEPRSLGRYNFTVAHEIGHVEVHAPFIGVSNKTILCRGESKARIEVEANHFAANLLMPEWLLREFIKKKYDVDFIILQKRRLIGSFPETNTYWAVSPGGSLSHPIFIEHIAEVFQVSTQAMGIRLKKLGIIVSEANAMERGLIPKKIALGV